MVCWASGTKVVTAALVRALVTDGLLDWEARITELLGAPAPDQMTVASLVKHRSGLPRTLPKQRPTSPDPYRQWTNARFDERVLPELVELAGSGTPSEVAYSNLGYAVLARALEIRLERGWLRPGS